MTAQFWETMQELLLGEKIVIDRPAGNPHPKFPDLIYPLDYGFIENTKAGDGDGIDVWLGSLQNRKLTGILCTFDTVKRDAEIKLLAGCTKQDIDTILCFNLDFMSSMYIPNPKENQ